MRRGAATRNPAAARSLRRWVVGGAALGALAVLVTRLAIEFVDFGPNVPPTRLPSWHPLDLLALLCPAPLLLWPDGGAEELDLLSSPHLSIGALANAALYALLAAMVCLSLQRTKALLIAPMLLLAIIWYAIWPA